MSESTKRYRVGVIGFGSMGRGWSGALTASAHWDLVSICDISPKARELAKQKYPTAQVTDNPEPLFDDRSLDVVGIFTLADQRPPLIERALQSGKHLLLEKPVAADLATEERMLELIESSGRQVAVDLFNRNAWYHHEALAFIESGEIGELAIVRARHESLGLLPTADRMKMSKMIANHLLFLGMMILMCLTGTNAESAELAPQTQPSVLLSVQRLAELKQAIAEKHEPTYTAWLEVKNAADAAIDRKPNVPAVWHVPGYYKDKDAHAKAKEGLMNDANAAYTLALAYQMTGNDKYAKAAAAFVIAWAGLKELKTGEDSELCFSYHFPAMIFAADLLRGSSALTQEQEAEFSKFLVDRALPMNTMKRDNNWGNWGLVLFTSIAAYQNDAKQLENAATRWKELLERQVNEDGVLDREVGRNGGRSGMWYSHFSLFPQTIAAEILRVQGHDVYTYKTPKGRTLRMAYEKLLSWSLKPETFPHWKGDVKVLHGRDYYSYFELLYPRWPSPAGKELLEKNRPLSARHSLPWLTFTHGTQIVVNESKPK